MSVDLSIVMPLYNHEQYIAKTLKCIESQQINLELIIIDDMSTDTSIEIVKEFKKNSSLNITLLQNTTKKYALASRLLGVKNAQSENILFMDSDDNWLGTDRLSKALKLKLDNNCDILHFSTRLLSPEGIEEGEALWTRPFSFSLLKGNEVFDGFMSRHYPPIVLWDKILSKSLLLKVIPIIEQIEIKRFDDKFLVSLLMLFANSYLGCKEYIYEYKASNIFPLEKYLARIHDLFTLWDTISPLMQKRQISPQVQEKYRVFIKRRIAHNLGNACIKSLEKLENNIAFNSVLDIYKDFLTEDEILFAFVLSLKNNFTLLNQKINALSHYFPENDIMDMDLDVCIKRIAEFQKTLAPTSKPDKVLVNLFNLLQSKIDIQEENSSKLIHEDNIKNLRNICDINDLYPLFISVNTWIAKSLIELSKN